MASCSQESYEDSSCDECKLSKKHRWQHHRYQEYKKEKKHYGAHGGHDDHPDGEDHHHNRGHKEDHYHHGDHHHHYDGANNEDSCSDCELKKKNKGKKHHRVYQGHSSGGSGYQGIPQENGHQGQSGQVPQDDDYYLTRQKPDETHEEYKKRYYAHFGQPE